MVPVLVLLGAIGLHVLAVGHAWIEARSAARVIEREALIGSRPSAGLDALPAPLKGRARLRRVGEDNYEVSVIAPLPGPVLRVPARSR